MANLATLSTINTSLLSLSNLILVTPDDTGYQPQNPDTNDGEILAQSPAFFFDYEGEQSVQLQSEITDHYAEDNKSLQDQISIKPVIYTTRGFIGELNDVIPLAPNIIRQILSKLTIISAYTPELTVAALRA